uniref:hypothetical protein n=1 Tax=Verrucosispora sioxanthis TaxID=2499994 RepID=UPI001F27EBE6|nr:hypothetical protein [Verrucosispora sioxanthis]
MSATISAALPALHLHRSAGRQCRVGRGGRAGGPADASGTRRTTTSRSRLPPGDRAVRWSG